MVKVNKVLLSLAALASVRANEPVYPGDPIPPLAPSAPAKPRYFDFIPKEYIDLAAGFVPVDSLKEAARGYGLGGVLEYIEGPQDKSAFTKAVESYVPGGAALIESASSLSEQYGEYLPGLPDLSGAKESALNFFGDYGTYLGGAAAIGSATAAYFNFAPAE
ncbi:hypothetical protein CONCODRAFT_9476 [Conidiobolus coronatus NRRL 28638]|uniref:Uncharacterized protein n=1 Tax=Conidiobolus coronatus (strain ATCC 28846 / CBS 209.66 / NRRL 28638) TaxID=796925 RepID=A0A137NZM6_CONC2|nr:hypothetical protein CONCODRAFT_9476 [Conidiobolus coronatus NRRL 28638]|eukprot:KXN68283.1 hypothetical protein CONCODRAFT_9476 [Conidiobolus coronatus NRRL 28638]